MRKAFGEKVRQFRHERGITGAMLGKALKCTQANISKLEAGKIKPSVEQAKTIAKALALSSEEAEELRELATNYLYDFDRWSFEETDQYYLYQNAIGSKEQSSTIHWAFSWNVIPGLFQTKEYVEEMHLPLNLEPRRLAEVIGARLKRQLVLENLSKTFRFVLAEQSLYTLVTSKKAHCEQLRQMRRFIGKREGRIAVRILPRDSRLTLIPNVNFVIFDFKSVLVDEQYKTFLVWYDGQVEAYKALYSDLWEKSASTMGALKLIDSAIQYFQR